MFETPVTSVPGLAVLGLAILMTGCSTNSSGHGPIMISAVGPLTGS
jgi:hypothetical protein